MFAHASANRPIPSRLALIHHAVAALARIADLDRRDVGKAAVEVIARAASTRTAVAVRLRDDADR